MGDLTTNSLDPRSRLCFPPDQGFCITLYTAGPGLKYYSPESYTSPQSLLVTHHSFQNTLCVVSWTSPTHSDRGADFYDVGRRNNILQGTRVSVIRSQGTSLSTYEVVLLGGTGYRLESGVWYQPDPTSFKYSPRARENFDVDLLEPLGLETLVSVAQRIRDAIGVPWQTWREDLDGYISSRAPLSVVPPTSSTTPVVSSPTESVPAQPSCGVSRCRYLTSNHNTDK